MINSLVISLLKNVLGNFFFPVRVVSHVTSPRTGRYEGGKEVCIFTTQSYEKPTVSASSQMTDTPMLDVLKHYFGFVSIKSL